MEKGLFRYKVFRQKFTITTVGVIVVVLMLSALSYVYYMSRWKDNFHKEAVLALQDSETRIRNGMELIETQMNRVYGNSELMADLRALLNSTNQEEYFRQRLENSTASRRLIRFFPEELNSFLLQHSSIISHVTVLGENTCNWIKIENGRPVIFYSDSVPSLEGCIEIEYTVYDPEFQYMPIGKIKFWVDINSLINSGFATNSRWFAITDSKENIIYISGDSKVNREIMGELKYYKSGENIYPVNFFNRLYSVNNDFLQSQYIFYACIYESELIFENTMALVFTFMVLIFIGGVFIVFYYYNLKDDAHFLDRILSTINSVKRGDFSAAKGDVRAGNNEYGMIARELNDMSRELQEHIIAVLHLKIEQQDAEMRALQHQINPHFLYNTLEVIRSRSLINNDKATSDAIADLGAIYRGVVKNDTPSTIGSEVELMKKYLRLMSYRYPENFFSQISVEESLLSVPTVKFWMQPLAENFFIHGFNSEGEYNLLIINGQQDNDGYMLEILDNGVTLPDEKLAQLNDSLLQGEGSAGTSIGLSNVYTRLRYFYGEGFAMKIENNLKCGVRIILHIPQTEK